MAKSFYAKHKTAVVVGGVGLGIAAIWLYKKNAVTAASSSSTSVIPLTTNSGGQTVSTPSAPTPLDSGAVTSDTNQDMGDTPPPADG